jgi:rSAM/selenodomain-associated transferase 1
VRIAVFAKAPVAGEVKTRLAAVIGDSAAAQLHARLVHRALRTALDARIGPVDLWCAPDERHEFFVRCASEMGVALRRQEGADLGHRMSAAFGDAFARGEPLLLIGSDCPALAPSHLRDAAASLATHDAVLGPADDGGYVLVGLARDVARLFDGIAWGGADVMAATRSRLEDAHATWHELPVLWDVDRPEDYARLQREGLLPEAAT